MDLRGRVGTLALLALAALAAMPAVASATTYQVNTTADHASNGCQQPPLGDCTIRDAMNVGLTTQDVIRVPAGTYQLTVGELVVPNGSLQGAGARSTIIRAAANNRVIRIGTEAITGISGVTVTGGVAPAGQQGGGIFVPASAALALVNSAVVGNRAPEAGGIWTQGRALVLNGTTVSGNTATLGLGGGISVDASISPAPSSVPATLTNSTVSGNTASGGRANTGGGILTQGALTLDHTTVANNRVLADGAATVEGGGIYQANGVGGGAAPTTTIRDSIIAGNTFGACAGNTAIFAGDHNLDDDGTCGFGAVGDKSGVNPLLGALGNRGGPTDTHALGAPSPALNAADAPRCPDTDQRAIARPQLGGCDMGATEYVAPRLVVTTTVVNDDTGTATPASFSVRVIRSGAGDVPGSPKPGTPTGSAYTLTPGGYVVSSSRSGYTVTYGGACTAAGAVSLAENQAKTCTVVANDIPLPPPKIRKTANLLRASGTVKIKKPGSKTFTALQVGEQVPLGTIVDARNGRVRLIAASDNKGGTASAVFYAGIFKIGQTKGKKPITVLTLVEKLTGCKASAGKASAAAKKKRKRRLWGDGKGRFRTKGKRSAATVVGTKWLVEDRCTSTLTKVARGKVSVRDFVKKKTVLVKKGRKYVARAR